MKTIFIFLILISAYITASESVKFATFNFDPIPMEASWIKSEEGMWLGSFNVWYKIDTKSYNVKVSYNKKKLVSTINAAWH